MTNPPVVLRTEEAREAADHIMAKLNSIQPTVFDYKTRNGLSYLARIAQESFNDLKAGEELSGGAREKAISDAVEKFEEAYRRVMALGIGEEP